MSSARPTAPRPRPRPRGPDRRRRAGGRSSRTCRSSDPREPAPAAPALRARGDGRPRRARSAAGRAPAGRRAAAAEGGYELIAGERRWRAAREAGLATLPAVIREADDRDTLLLALVENVAREQLSPVEEARAYASLMDEFELSLGDVAERVGRSKPAVSNRLRLLELPDDVLWMVARGELTEGHARAVLALPDHDARRSSRSGSSARAVGPRRREGGAGRRRRAQAARRRPRSTRRSPRARATRSSASPASSPASTAASSRSTSAPRCGSRSSSRCSKASSRVWLQSPTAVLIQLRGAISSVG